MKRPVYKNGDIINGIQLIELAGLKTWPSGQTSKMAYFKCSCGIKFKSRISQVVLGDTRSCGCLAKRLRTERFTTHGLVKHPLYETWRDMKRRCLDRRSTGYKYWGGRGIKISDEFLNPSIWIKYVESLPNYKHRVKNRLTIDRINNDGNYERGNLRWATRKQQNTNQQKHYQS